jgi:hypothetical protein
MRRDDLYLETDKFEHREVKEHFINACCFGEDFAAWLRDQIRDLSGDGYIIREPIQEDYGWGFWVEHDSRTFWVALSYAEEGPVQEPAHWVASVAWDAGLDLVQRFFRPPRRSQFEKLRDRIHGAIRSAPDIKVLTEDEWTKLA